MIEKVHIILLDFLLLDKGKGSEAIGPGFKIIYILFAFIDLFFSCLNILRIAAFFTAGNVAL